MNNQKLQAYLNRAAVLIGMVAIAACSSSSSTNEQEMENGKTTTQEATQQPEPKAPTQDKVPLVAPTDLQNLLSSEDIVLLDTRSPEEYETGHLEGSRLVNFQTFRLADVKDIPKDASVVVYCAVGGRSNRIGMQLIEAGYLDVHNLEGGIANWKSQGHTVVYD